MKQKQRCCTIRVAKTKALISFAVTAKLICAFVFALAFCWFSYAMTEIGTKILQGLHLFGNVRVNAEEEIMSIE